MATWGRPYKRYSKHATDLYIGTIIEEIVIEA
jgi:hypothetical protein